MTVACIRSAFRSNVNTKFMNLAKLITEKFCANLHLQMFKTKHKISVS